MLRSVQTVTTADLSAGNTVNFGGSLRTVVSLEDTGRFPLFGTGTVWEITLEDAAGTRTSMVAPTSERWTRA